MESKDNGKNFVETILNADNNGGGKTKTIMKGVRDEQQ
jgi:hypothetical protein